MRCCGRAAERAGPAHRCDSFRHVAGTARDEAGRPGAPRCGGAAGKLEAARMGAGGGFRSDRARLFLALRCGGSAARPAAPPHRLDVAASILLWRLARAPRPPRRAAARVLSVSRRAHHGPVDAADVDVGALLDRSHRARDGRVRHHRRVRSLAGRPDASVVHLYDSGDPRGEHRRGRTSARTSTSPRARSAGRTPRLLRI